MMRTVGGAAVNTEQEKELRKYTYLLHQHSLQDEVLRACLHFLDEFQRCHSLYGPLEQLHTKSEELLAYIKEQEGSGR